MKNINAIQNAVRLVQLEIIQFVSDNPGIPFVDICAKYGITMGQLYPLVKKYNLLRKPGRKQRVIENAIKAKRAAEAAAALEQNKDEL
jgi:hypothetical protein